MLDRLVGLETEYAIRFSPERPADSDGSAGDPGRPGNDVVYQALVGGLKGFVHTRRGDLRTLRQQLFTENGGALAYEALPRAMHGGLVEGGTPECRGPSELLLYQRAQDGLLLASLPAAEAELAVLGFPGRLGLLKNCRDAEGHVYGAQENYEADLASGWRLAAYRLGLALVVVPATLVASVGVWAVMGLLILLGMAALILAGVAALLVPPVRPALGQLFSGDRDSGGLTLALGRLSYVLDVALFTPCILPLAGLFAAFGFRDIRRGALAFLLSRSIITGAGTVDAEGQLLLSEKGPAIRRLIRTSISPDNRPVFDTGNLMKALTYVHMGRFGPLASLFKGRQRLQLGLSDSNGCQVAEYLKVGATSLVVDMAEAGALADAPQLRRPIRALKAIIADPTLQATVELRDGRSMTALALQRWYLDAARRFMRSAAAPSLEAHEVVRVWEDALARLESGQLDSLVGRLDWVTKRWLLRSLDADASWEARKKLDLRYHELGDGYLARLEAAGVAEQLVEPAEIQAAMVTPPANTPARSRGRLIRDFAERDVSVTVSWSHVRLGSRFGGKVIRLDDYRD